MMRITWLSASLAAMLLTASIGWAQESKPQTQPAADKGKLKGEWAIMASKTKLTEAQIEKVAAKVQAQTEAVEKWNKENADALAKAQAAVDEATKANDNAALRTARTALRTAQAPLNDIKTKGAADIESVLTAEQKAIWEPFKLVRQVESQLGRSDVKLTDAQETKANDLAKATYEKIKALETQDNASVRPLTTELFKSVVDTVLTDEQKKAYEAKASTQPARGGRGRAATP